MLLAVNGGLARGGVGSCRIGNGGALLARGSVTPGMDGIKGGRDMPRERTGETNRPTAERVEIEGNMLEVPDRVISIEAMYQLGRLGSECDRLSGERV